MPTYAEQKEAFRANGLTKLAAITELPLTFGVEIEAKGNTPAELERKLHAAGILNVTAQGYNHRDNYDGQWKIVTDATVRGGAEVVSPVLSGPEGIAEIIRMTDAVKAAGSYADRNCGLHVHFGVRGNSLKVNQRFLALFTRYEQVLDALINVDRRGSANGMARATVSDRSADTVNNKIANIKAAKNLDELHRVMGYDRYQKINTMAAYSSHGTYEVRMHHGTVDSTEIVQWVTLLSELWRWAISGLGNAQKLKSTKTLKKDVQDFGGRLDWYDSAIYGDFKARIKSMGAAPRAARRRPARTVTAADVVTVQGESCPCLDCQINAGNIVVEA